MPRKWIGDAGFMACDFGNPGLLHAMGLSQVTFTRRKAGGYWIDGPADQLVKVVREVRDRYFNNGGEGFQDGLPAMRSLSAFMAREGWV